MACCLVGTKPLCEPMLDIVNSNPGNKIQWNLKRKPYILFHENTFATVGKMTILSAFQCVKWEMTIVLEKIQAEDVWDTDWKIAFARYNHIVDIPTSNTHYFCMFMYITWLLNINPLHIPCISRNFFKGTLLKAKQMRPDAKWGYYIYPKCNYKVHLGKCPDHMYEYVTK